MCDSKTSDNAEASDYVQGLGIKQKIDFTLECRWEMSEFLQ